MGQLQGVYCSAPVIPSDTDGILHGFIHPSLVDTGFQPEIEFLGD